jgi:5-methylcytosine-specific restriction protein B
MILHERIFQEVKERHEELYGAGELPSREQLARYYATFRRQFGPERLQGLDGKVLLETMHAHGSSNWDSLVYWLEFKKDDELPGIFGSISGGSALKFGIYRRQETGAWMTGSSQNQVEITTEEAIEIARKHRDQLVRGVELLEELPANGDDSDYRWLQEQMNILAPDVSGKAWGHKYFHMLYPNKLDDYHVEDYQRFHLIKLLQLPPEGSGRYLAAGRYVAIAKELDIPINHLATTLNRRDERPHNYWRVLVNYPDVEGWKNNWTHMRDGGYLAIGWSKLGDLSDIQYKQESKDRVRALMKTHYGDKGGWTQEIFHFAALMEEGDLVLAFERSQVLGIGRVAGPYTYMPSTPDIPHHRSMEWLSEEEWELPEPEAKGRAVRQIKLPINLVETEKRVYFAPPIERRSVDSSGFPLGGPSPLRLGGISGRIQSVLERKNQVILYGPPGTGKTYWAIHTAWDLASHASFGRLFSELTDDQRQFVQKGKDDVGALVRVCTFHPAYGYEDFIEGYRPHESEGQLVFKRQDGIFRKLCKDAHRHPDRRFYLIIDEINRGDVPRIFGELLTVLEKDKRGQDIALPLSGELFSVPSNVYVIGTMNTADRSIALLDTALRRRFGFVELMPDSSTLEKAVVANSIPLRPWLDALNSRILEHIGRDARNLQIGHAYLLENDRPVADFGRFARIIQDDILPLLEEYCYEDYATLAKILGSGLVDENRQRIHHELFAPARRDDLRDALLAPAPDIATSPQVVASESEQLDEQDEEDLSVEQDETTQHE